jgi:uncharacterized lipoprotein YajG
MPREMVPM